MGRRAKNVTEIETVRQAALDAICFNGKPSDSLFPMHRPKARGYIAKKSKNHQCPHTKEYLESLYIKDGLSRPEVAKALGVHVNQVNRWFVLMDIRLTDEARAERTNNQSRMS